jgi:hypothetical protein
VTGCWPSPPLVSEGVESRVQHGEAKPPGHSLLKREVVRLHDLYPKLAVGLERQHQTLGGERLKGDGLNRLVSTEVLPIRIGVRHFSKGFAQGVERRPEPRRPQLGAVKAPPQRAWYAHQASWKETESPIALAIVRLLLLTGFRISEGQGLEREWVSAAEGYVGFPDTKGDARFCQHSRQQVRVDRCINPVTRRSGC